MSAAQEDLRSDPRWVSTLQAWAEDAACAEIRLNESSAFARIWMISFVIALVAVACSAVPYFWCKTWGERDDAAETVARERDGGEPGDERDLGATGGSALTGASSVSSRRVSVQGVVSKKPDLATARQHLLDTSAGTDALGQWRPVWGTKMTAMGQLGGTGLELYFRMLRALGFCFLYMAVWTTPIWIFCLEGNFVPDTGSITARTTIGNLGSLARGGTPQEMRHVVVGCQAIDIKQLTAIFGWLDSASILIYITFIAYFRFRVIPKVKRACDAASVTCGDYAVTIDCLPSQLGEEEHKTFEEQLREHVARVVGLGNTAKKKKRGLFSSTHTEASLLEADKRVEVPEVFLVRDYGKKLSSLKERAQSIVAKEVAEYHGDDKTAEALENALQKTRDKLAETLKEEVEMPVVKAYVILNSAHDKDTLLSVYRWANYRAFRCKFCNHRFRETHSIRVRAAPEPTNIYWENQDVPAFERRVRKVVMFGIWLVIMAISTGIIWYSSMIAKTQGGNVGSQSLGSETCDSGTRGATADGSGEETCDALEAMTWTLDYALNLTATADIDCFCVTKGYSTIVQSAEMRDLCYDWLVAAGKSMGIGVMSSFVVVVVNTILKMCVAVFSEQEKPASITEQNSSIMVKVFVSQFINTIAIVWLLNNSILSIFGEDFGGQYDGFERGWYASVGGPLVVTVAVNAVTASITYLSTWGMQGFTRTFQRRHQGLYIHGEDAPGPYVLALGSGNLTVVTNGSSLSSDELGHLNKNTYLEIKEVCTLDEERLVRGRVEEAGPFKLSGWVSLCSTTDGYRWASRVAKSCCREKVVQGADDPGRYKVVHGGNDLTTVTEGPSEISPSVGVLPRNAKVEVLELNDVQAQQDEKRVRGRVEGEVAGWITLVDTDTGLRRASHSKRSPVGPLAVKHEAELTAQYTSPPFDMASRYAQVLTMCYITLVFSAGLPIVNWLAALFCFVTYWSDKTVLLRGSYRPPAYDTQMAYQASQLCLYAAPLHLVAAIWMYSHPCIFPSDPLGGDLVGNFTSLAGNLTSAANLTNDSSSASQLGVDDFVSADGFIDKITRESTWILFILLAFFLVLAGLQVVMFVVGSAFGEALSVVRMACCRTRTPAPSDAEGKGAEKPVDDAEALKQRQQAAKAMLWPEAMVYIEEITKRAASYRMDLNPEWRPLLKEVRKEAQKEDSLAGTLNSSAGPSLAVSDLRQAADASEAALRTDVGNDFASPAASPARTEVDEGVTLIAPAPQPAPSSDEPFPPDAPPQQPEEPCDPVAGGAAPERPALPPDHARGLVEALRREYVDSGGAAVGDFFGALPGLQAEDVAARAERQYMEALEEEVREAPDKRAAVDSIAARLQVLDVQDVE